METPGPIPNPAVKHGGADGRATKSRKVPRKNKQKDWARKGPIFFVLMCKFSLYKEKTNALTAASALFDTYTLGHLLREIVKPIIEKVLGVTASFSWAFPAILILEATISTLLVLLDHFA